MMSLFGVLSPGFLSGLPGFLSPGFGSSPGVTVTVSCSITIFVSGFLSPVKVIVFGAGL